MGIRSTLCALALALSSVACSPNMRVLHHQNYLTQNSENLTRQIVSISESDGVRQMAHLARTTLVEEKYAYLHDIQSYVEISSHERVEHSRPFLSGVVLDRPYIRNMFSERDHITLYHYHPDFFTQQDRTGTPAEIRNAIANQVLPSTEDLLVMFSLECEFSARQEQGNLTHRIVSSFGVTEYDVIDNSTCYDHISRIHSPIMRIRHDRDISVRTESEIYTVSFTPFENTDSVDNIFSRVE